MSQVLVAKLQPFVERLDALTLRERIIIFGAGVALIYIAWQTLVMEPLSARTKVVEQHLTEVRGQTAVIDQLGAASAQDPAVAAAVRNRALSERLSALDREISSVAQGYIAPQHMTDLLRALLAEQHELKLVSLDNLPVESLSTKPESPNQPDSTNKPQAAIDRNDRGPFLHPVEMVIEGDYPSVVAYLRALEALPWHLHWRRLELTAEDYPRNRVHLVIGALSLSRDWISV